MRIVLTVTDPDDEVARLTEAGVRFRNDIVNGPGGRQTLVRHSSGNLAEMFQSA